MPNRSLPPLPDVLAHEPFVRAVASAVLGGDPAVEDVLQQTWMAACGRPPGAVPRGWLARVARNFALIALRRGRRQRVRETRAARHEALPSTLEIVERGEARQQLVAGVLALDEPYRTALLWRYYRGLGPSEIARLLELPLDTVKTRLRRGLHSLRAQLERRGPEARSGLLAWATLRVGSGVLRAGAGGLIVKKLALGLAVGLLLASGLYLALDRLQHNVAGDDADSAILARAAGPSQGAAVGLGARGPELESGTPLARPPTTAEPVAPGRPSPVAQDGHGPAVEGQVVDQEGAPVVGAHLFLLREGVARQPHGTSDAQGRFRIPDATWDAWTLCVRVPPPFHDWGHVPQGSLVHGGERDVRIRLVRRPTGRCDVRVRAISAANGASLALSELYAFDARLSLPGADPTASDTAPPPRIAEGLGQIGPLRPGRWRIWALAGEPARWALAELEVGRDQVSADVGLRFESPGGLRGRVDARQVPAEAFPLYVQARLVAGWMHPPGATQLLFRASKLRGDGTFEFEDLIPGVWEVEVAGGGATDLRQVEVLAAGVAEVALQPLRGASLRFRSLVAVPGAQFELQVAEGDGPYRGGRHAGVLRPLDESRSVRPGRVRWRLRFPAEASSESVRLAADSVEGEAVVEAGEVLDVAVPIVPR